MMTSRSGTSASCACPIASDGDEEPTLTTALHTHTNNTHTQTVSQHRSEREALPENFHALDPFFIFAPSPNAPFLD